MVCPAARVAVVHTDPVGRLAARAHLGKVTMAAVGTPLMFLAVVAAVLAQRVAALRLVMAVTACNRQSPVLPLTMLVAAVEQNEQLRPARVVMVAAALVRQEPVVQTCQQPEQQTLAAVAAVAEGVAAEASKSSELPRAHRAVRLHFQP